MSTKAEALQSVITWIPVSEPLPEEGREYLIASRPYAAVAVWRTDFNEWQGATGARWKAKYITYYAELPTPPASVRAIAERHGIEADNAATMLAKDVIEYAERRYKQGRTDINRSQFWQTLIDWSLSRHPDLGPLPLRPPRIPRSEP